MSYVDFVTPAITYAKQASKLDEEKKYQEAYDLYFKSINFFMKAIEYEKHNPHKKKLLSDKTKDILSRAEKIKTFLKEKKKDIEEENEDGTSTGKKKIKSGDKDKDKLRAAIEGAIIREKPNVTFKDVAGLVGAKEALKEAVILPLKYPQLFTGKRTPWRGILLYGPPGTGKSYLAKAVANEADCTFFSVSSSDLVSKWQGESERLVRNLFEMAREEKPSIIFIDEVDSLCSSRSDGENDSTRRIKTEFLVQMQGVGKSSSGVLVLAATNIPWNLDSAVRRRFERRVLIPLPDVEARKRIFEIHVGSTKTKVGDKEFALLAKKTQGYSGSDISIIVRNALMEPIRAIQMATHFKKITGPDPQDKTKTCYDLMTPCSPSDPYAIECGLSDLDDPSKLVPGPVTYADFLKAIQMTKPSVGKDDVKQHDQFTKEFGQDQ